MRRNAVFLLLAAAVAVLLAVALVEPGREAAPEISPLTSLPPEAVEAFSIERPDTPTRRLTRRDGRWRVEAPFDAPASESKVRSLLGILSATSQRRLAPEEVSLPALELDPPRARLLAGDRVIDFGTTHPLSGLRYVMTEGAVHLLTDLHYHHAIAEPAAWVAPRLLPAGAEPVAITIPHLRVEREESGGWRTAAGDLPPGSQADFARAWRDAEAVRVRALTPGADQGQVLIEFAGGERLGYRVLASDPALVLADDARGLEYHFDAALTPRLLGRSGPADDGGAEDAGTP